MSYDGVWRDSALVLDGRACAETQSNAFAMAFIWVGSGCSVLTSFHSLECAVQVCWL